MSYHSKAPIVLIPALITNTQNHRIFSDLQASRLQPTNLHSTLYCRSEKPLLFISVFHLDTGTLVPSYFPFFCNMNPWKVETREGVFFRKQSINAVHKYRMMVHN